MVKNLITNKILLFLFALALVKPGKAQHDPPGGNVVMAPCALCYSMSNVNVGLTCPATGTFYDSGGSGGNYSNSENFTKTFTVPVGNCVSFTFTTFQTETCCDFLKIYDGPNNTFPLMGTYSGTLTPWVVNATGNSMTFVFTSDISNVSTGWDATPGCVPSCTSAPIAGTAQASPSQSCVAYSSTLSLTGNAYACGVSYQWQSAGNIAGPYTNVAGATSITAVMNNTVTTFYRCIISCGGFTAASSPATCSLVPAGACALCNIQSIASLPFNSGNQTNCGNGNNVTSGNVTNICGSSLYYGGEDAVWSFTPAATGVVTLGVGSPGSFIGLMLYQGCPTMSGTCVGYSQNSCCGWTLCANVTAGQTYYAVIDSWPAPSCNQYTLSISAPGSCVGTINSVTATASPTQACSSLTSTLTLSGVAACIPTYQWQQSTSPGGPWTNIAGQTNPTAIITTTQTLYYQCFMTCASNTAVSSVQQLSVSSFTPPPCSLTTYSASSTTFSLDVFVGTVLPTTDDVLFSTISTFGFPFCFTGQQLSQGYVSSNGAFVFDAMACFPNILPMPGGVNASPGIWTGWSISQPAPTSIDYTPRNAVMGPWQDIYPTIGGTIRFGTLGTAPNRRFVASFENVPMFSCTTLSFTGQIKLFETSNNIEIHVATKTVCATWNSGRAIMGLHNYDGTVYSPPVNMTAHNSPTQWTMFNTAYRWTSTCPSQSICGTVLPVSFKALYGQNFDDINKIWWETVSEENMKEFQVERSMDAMNFEVIQTVQAAGKPNTYVCVDNSFKRGYINYYRVTGYGKNGEKYTTSVYPIYSTDEKVTITAIYPNPTAEQLSVSIMGRTTANYSFIIYDQLGNVVLKKDQAIQFGTMQVDLNIASLANGVYVLEIKSTENASISRKKFSKF